MNFVVDIPIEVFLQILGYLSGKELLNARAVCRLWKEIVGQELVWKRVFEREGLDWETVVDEDLEIDRDSYWPMKYVYMASLRDHWLNNKGIDFYLPYPASNVSLDSNGILVAVADEDQGGGDLWLRVGSQQEPLVFVQKFLAGHTLTGVFLKSSTIVCVVNATAVIFQRAGSPEHFIKEVSVIPDKGIIGEDFERKKTTLIEAPVINKRYVWFQTSNMFKIFNRSSQQFNSLTVCHPVSILSNSNTVFILSPNCISLFTHSGEGSRVITEPDCFYTGLVSSPLSLAYLKSKDFEEPLPIYLDLATNREQAIQEQAYKLVLHQDNLIILSGLKTFTICRYKGTKLIWRTSLCGSKYIRPGQSRFNMISSLFILVSPTDMCLHCHALIDFATGAIARKWCDCDETVGLPKKAIADVSSRFIAQTTGRKDDGLVITCF